ncbi:hypothetical protein [Azospirillum thermophilum]|uniref:hypothetical protein n=1 Tax=Azospirillum thermophilum TaxID=2202148 RepID=UPI0011B7B32A|nr:hypothetical protein [Azospirillum thermophilum]
MPEFKFSLISSYEAVNLLAPCFGGTAPIHKLQAEKWIKSLSESRGIFAFYRQVTRYKVVNASTNNEGTFSDIIEDDVVPIMDFDKEITIDTEKLSTLPTLLGDTQKDGEISEKEEFFWGTQNGGARVLIRTRRYSKLSEGVITEYVNYSSEIYHSKEHILWLIGDPGGIEPIKQVKAEKTSDKRQYAKRWDWEGALIHLIKLADLNGLPEGKGVNERGKQARLEEIMAQWFADKNNGDTPANSELRHRARRIIDVLGDMD